MTNASGATRHALVAMAFAAVALAVAELTGRSLLAPVSAAPVPFGSALDAGTRCSVSLALGGLLAFAVISFTGRFLGTTRGRQWVDEVGGAGLGVERSAAIAVAALAAVSEELLFRGLLLPLVGIFLSSLLFGAAHALTGGRARWTWALAATLFALALGLLTRLTGSLAGALVAHVLVNVVNLPRVREAHARSAAPPGTLGRRSGGKALGGLLRRRA